MVVFKIKLVVICDMTTELNENVKDIDSEEITIDQITHTRKEWR